MTQKEFEEKMDELKERYGIPSELCFKMDANFTVEEDVKSVSAKRLSLTKTAAAADFFTHALNTNIERDMQILEAGILGKGAYMYIISGLKGVPSMQMIHPIFKDKDGDEIPEQDTEAEDFFVGKLMHAFTKAAKSMGEDKNAPRILMREADTGEPYEKIGGGDGKDIFMDFSVVNLGEMSEKERDIAMHVNRLFAEDEGVSPERRFVLEVDDKDKAVKSLDEYMTKSGKEYITCTYSEKDGKREENNYVYEADGKRCLVNFTEGEEKLLNGEPYGSLGEAFLEIAKSIN